MAKMGFLMQRAAGFVPHPEGRHDGRQGIRDIGAIAGPGRREIADGAKFVAAGEVAHAFDGGVIGERDDQRVEGVVPVIAAVFFIPFAKQAIEAPEMAQAAGDAAGDGHHRVGLARDPGIEPQQEFPRLAGGIGGVAQLPLDKILRFLGRRVGGQEFSGLSRRQDTFDARRHLGP